MFCEEHDYEDVTEERQALLEKRGELPQWIQLLIEKKDRKWQNPGQWRNSQFLKCRECGLVRVNKLN